YTIMLTSNTLNDADLKSRLARFGINYPITNTTRNVLFKKLLKLEMDSQNERNNQSNKFDRESMVKKYTNISSRNILNNADLKSRLARFGISNPITNTTRNILLKKLLKLEMDSQNERKNQSNEFNFYFVLRVIEFRVENCNIALLKGDHLFEIGVHNQIFLCILINSKNKINFNEQSYLNKYTIMSSSNILNDADLKSRLARFGISSPITNTTRNILLKKLLKLEMDSQNECNDQSNKSDCESMDTTTNDLNEYEIRDGISKYGLKPVPLTDSTRPVISSIIRKKSGHS
ncbi:Uncharacterized protein FWK35_00010472, partial [Aphis craccivora]